MLDCVGGSANGGVIGSRHHQDGGDDLENVGNLLIIFLKIFNKTLCFFIVGFFYFNFFLKVENKTGLW